MRRGTLGPGVPPGAGTFCHAEVVARAQIAAAERGIVLVGRVRGVAVLGDPEWPREAVRAKPRRIDDDEIVHRLVLALVNEGAAILEEGIALRASDIDMVYLTGYGFPLHRGGPMLYADMMGLYNVVDRMKQFAANPHGDPAFWTPAPLLAKLAAEGKSFNG